MIVKIVDKGSLHTTTYRQFCKAFINASAVNLFGTINNRGAILMQQISNGIYQTTQLISHL